GTRISLSTLTCTATTNPLAGSTRVGTGGGKTSGWRSTYGSSLSGFALDRYPRHPLRPTLTPSGGVTPGPSSGQSIHHRPTEGARVPLVLRRRSARTAAETAPAGAA